MPGGKGEAVTSPADPDETPTVLAGFLDTVPRQFHYTANPGSPWAQHMVDWEKQDPISTTIPAVFITSKIKIHLLPKGLSAIKRLEYLYANNHSHNWKAHSLEGTWVLRIHHRHIQVTQHISALFPMGAQGRKQRGTPPGTSLLQTQQPQEIFANVFLEKKKKRGKKDSRMRI